MNSKKWSESHLHLATIAERVRRQLRAILPTLPPEARVIVGKCAAAARCTRRKSA